MERGIDLSLISHTNVGKTTLARTLLRRDVGEVLDEAHVTDESVSYELLRIPGARLTIWDTPGFGDTARLIRRLRHEGDPLGWFLHQVWDRWVDRPMWCSQQAAINVRDHADVVLYLVNANESPLDAGYPELELQLLEWMGLPVLLVLNQVGEGQAAHGDAWRNFAAERPLVRDVLTLDAFTRGWPQESQLFHRVAEVLEGPAQETMRNLADAWDARNRRTFDEACAEIAGYLARAATDIERLHDGESSPGGWLDFLSGKLRLPGAGQTRAMERLGERLNVATGSLMSRLIELHGLEGDSVEPIEQDMQDYRIEGGAPIDERSGAIVGAMASGAAAGLAADALAGGLTLGGGLIAGTILGALGGVGLAKGYKLISGSKQPAVRWSAGFLDELFRQGVLRYLAVAHFGRGQGLYEDRQRPQHWTRTVDQATACLEGTLHRIWEEADDVERSTAELTAIVATVTIEILQQRYPDSPALRDGSIGRSGAQPV